eukprot:CAMPEP_0170524652 /NCGR_PEP_ID=MMETSP0209-20121228/10144_1 /TAXON_ID=665100 ORGANISM="Litonotus pictus, Strain P1" /NCGR_SAMPLE_ID=MMETSP0209 /ASSEMBLY_ACC=CAM_ASM_000301 /LENGTH=208 /DNA_ID=CAMNT_0010813491 /DNA_START=780 /DNA_END=1406 /DNA_ORIENTATION=-
MVYDMNTIKKLSKTEKISINEFFTGCLLAAIKEKRPEGKRITMEVPIGLTPLPKRPEDVSLANHVFALFNQMKLIGDPLKEREELRKDYMKLIGSLLFVRISEWGTWFIMLFFPFNFVKSIICGVVEEVDIVCSNLPAPESQENIADNKLVSIVPYCTTGNISNSVVMVSYNNQMKVVGIYDSGQDFDMLSLCETFNRIVKDHLDIYN